jgi:hypothetical protein
MFRREAVLVAVPGGLVACVPGAVTGIESKAVIDGTSLSGAMSQDRSAFSSAHQGRAPQPGAEVRELPGRAGLKGVRLARDYSSPASGMTAVVRRLQASGHELKGGGGLALG